MTILETQKEHHVVRGVSKLGKSFMTTKTRTVFKIKCDACGRIFTRSKSEMEKSRIDARHACSPECIGKMGKKPGYAPRAARRKSGYIFIGQKRQHKIIVEQKLGRALSRKELVHHIDGDKGNNDLENLLVCHNSKEHNRIHGQLEALAFLLYQKGTIKFCHDCRLYFLDKCYCSV